MTEACCKCGRARPYYIADPTCPKGGGYCDWKIGSEDLPVVERIEAAYRLLATAEECEDADGLLDLCVAAREILKPGKQRTG